MQTWVLGVFGHGSGIIFMSVPYSVDPVLSSLSYQRTEESTTNIF